jgi:ribosomal protein S28E/S33
MLKNWFLLASVSCGVGFGSTFVISRNLQQSAWAGLVTVPAVTTSLTLLSRQRRQEIERQVAKSRSNLDDIRQQEQLVQASCREISAHGQKLQTGFTQLRQNIDRDQEKQAELEQEINTLVLYKQKQEFLLFQLEEQVNNKQNNLEKTNAELAQSESKRKLAINSAQQSELTLANIQEKIRQDSAIKEQIKPEIIDLRNQERSIQREIDSRRVELTNLQQQLAVLKNRQEISLANIQEKICQHSDIKEQIKTEIIDLRDQERNIQREIDSRRVDSTNLQQKLAEFRDQQEMLLSAIDDLERSVKDRQSLLNELDLEILNRRTVKKEINSQTIEPKEQASQSTLKEEQLQAKRWQDNSVFENNPHLQILEHIDRHGKITESEVNHMLRNPRKGREFANKLREYLPELHFSIIVETSESGSCYLKEIKPQNFPEIPEPIAIDLEEQAMQDLSFDLESQSSDYFIGNINTYNSCRSCGSTPVRGHDYCYNCN